MKKQKRKEVSPYKLVYTWALELQSLKQFSLKNGDPDESGEWRGWKFKKIKNFEKRKQGCNKRQIITYFRNQ